MTPMFKLAAGAAFVLCAVAAQAAGDTWTLPVKTRTLDNGLTVVVSEDHTSPTVGVSVVYKIGMRREPQGRTGFAHLFEHMMFQGTPTAPKGVFDQVVQGGGGVLNGSTRADYTNYIESAPVSALEPILWLEADRMKTLDFSPQNLKNQQDVVKEEIRVNVKNQPYGLFFWTDIARLAFSKWENAHDGYGSFADLESANLEDVAAFHRDYYGPNNAVIGIVGDIKAEQAFALVEKYFGALPARPVPKGTDPSEPLNTAEKRESQTDALAQVPAVALAWKAPAQRSPDQAAMAVLSHLLMGDSASRLYQGLVKGRQIAVAVQGGYNWPLGNAWDFSGPALLTVFALHRPDASADAVVAAIDEELEKIRKEGVDADTLARVKTRLRANYVSGMEPFLSRADSLAKAQALWGDAGMLNQVPGWIDAVTSADLQRVVGTYLTKQNRVVIDRVPAAMAAAKQPAAAAKKE
ncbi:MAG TPA: pitrilysin family protein [Quisquiliibacterium sp.]|nr:pitrilysin family protein [Quisquiliibacterium sp.]